MHSLHAKNLVVALLVVEHGGREVVENVLNRQKAIGLVMKAGVV